MHQQAAQYPASDQYPENTLSMMAVCFPVLPSLAFFAPFASLLLYLSIL